MEKKTKIGVIFGGKSAEHEVSLQSAKNVVEAMDKKKYMPILIWIDKNGEWFLCNNQKEVSPEDLSGQKIALVPQGNGKIINLDTGSIDEDIDAAFPVLHGPFGEDGTVQGLLKIANIPFVGAGVLGSAVGMDKDVMKRILRDAGIAIGKFMTAYENQAVSYEEAIKKLGTPLFVKPSSQGSSVGVSKVENEKDFEKAMRNAFKYDRKVIVEEFIKGREVECSVLGNEEPAASVPGEIIANHEFYSYEAKYIDENGAALEIPAKLSEKTIKKVQDVAIKTFKALSCEGFARVDVFIDESGNIIVNEINTIPGFTKISMYPKLWEASGVSYTELIDKLIQLAFDRFEKEKKLKTSYE